MFKQTGHAQFNISKHQPWWIFLPSFKIVQSLNSGHSIFCWITKEAKFHVASCSRVNDCGSINISANYVAKCWPILLHFQLGNRSSCCFIYIHPVHRKNGKEHPLARAYTLFCFFNFDLFVFCCWPHQMETILNSIYTELDFFALVWMLFSCLAIFQKTAPTQPRLAISNTDNSNL